MEKPIVGPFKIYLTPLSSLSVREGRKACLRFLDKALNEKPEQVTKLFGGLRRHLSPESLTAARTC